MYQKIESIYEMQSQAQPFCSLELLSRKYHGVTYRQTEPLSTGRAERSNKKLQFFHTLQNFVQTMWSISGDCLLLQNNQDKRDDENKSQHIFFKTQTALTNRSKRIVWSSFVCL